MTPLESILWWSLIVLAVAGSALFSGLETGAYSLNRVRLQVWAHRGRRSAIVLRNLVQDPPTLLGTLLIGNNIANYTGAAALTVLLEGHGLGDGQTLLLNLLIVTPLLFIFGETLPKDLFGAYADRLMYSFWRVLDGARRLFTWTGLLPMVNLFSRLLARLMGARHVAAPFHPRRQVSSLVKEGVGRGLLSDEQSAIVERVLALRERTVGDEMVPWDEVITVAVDDPVDRLWTLAHESSRSRFPVVDAAGKVVGVLNIMDALIHPRDNCPPIRDLVHPPLFLPATMPLRSGLAKLRQCDDPLAIITDRDEPVGIVTMKDLVEPITGELAVW